MTPVEQGAGRADHAGPGPRPAEMAPRELHRGLPGPDHAARRPGEVAQPDLGSCGRSRSAWTRSSTSRTGSASALGCSPISRRRSAPTRSRRSSWPPPTRCWSMAASRSSPCWSSGSRTGTAARSCAATRAAARAAAGWPGTARRRRPMPDTRAQVVDPRNAYQMVSMLEGVVQRGTGKAAQEIGKPLAGKTGTTNDSKDTLVRRLLARSGRGGVRRLRPAPADGQEGDRRQPGPADLDRGHAGGARGPAGDAVPHAARAQPGAGRRGDRASSPAPAATP